jgi:integrase
MSLKIARYKSALRKVLNLLGFSRATLLAIRFRGRVGRTRERRMQTQGSLSLYSQAGARKYLNSAERRRFLGALRKVSRNVRLFCLVLLLSGGRLSETLAIAPAAIDLDTASIAMETLKRRKRAVIRHIPLPRPLLHELDVAFGLRAAQRDLLRAERRLWPWSRTTAWRRVKQVMALAEIMGPPATPKGLRHTFGVRAFQENVPAHLVQRWLGHASPRTTAIYGQVLGLEERKFAARLWNYR